MAPAPQSTKQAKQRIVGIDVARAVAVIGMIIVNFKVVFGAGGDHAWLKSLVQVFNGKAAATFVVLAGVGLALMTNSAVQDQQRDRLQKASRKIVNKALLLFVIGLSFTWIWPADILHYYGIYMLVTLLFIKRSPRQILVGTISLIGLYVILILLFSYEAGWDFSTLDYTGFWTIKGFFRNLFYNGFHPVVPWTAFMLFGLWYGRQDLYDDRFVRRSFWVSLGVFIIIQAVSVLSIQWLSNGSPEAVAELTPLLGTEPMPPLPLYMLNGISIAAVTIAACILLARRFETNRLTHTLRKTGQLALTIYAAHVVLGMGAVEGLGPLPLGTYPIEFSVGYALLFSLLCILFAELWLRFYASGPLEWLMRKLTN